ncbi:hypothetical protein R1flu_011204 [Riccia fluitans]|uniref:Secreted protein n=1 Tax=Riccia fluitans TaxID=41844 RepID=A0ABD1Z763_9MARC
MLNPAVAQLAALLFLLVVFRDSCTEQPTTQHSTPETAGAGQGQATTGGESKRVGLGGRDRKQREEEREKRRRKERHDEMRKEEKSSRIGRTRGLPQSTYYSTLVSRAGH